jgi:SAM-dependent methyltransferase
MSVAFPEAYFGSEDQRIPSAERIRSTLAPFKRHLLRFIESLPENAKVLDVGCGAGKTIKMILALRPDVTVSGMDISDVSGHLPSAVRFKIGTVEEIPLLFPNETFDAIICQHVIEHLLYPMGLMDGITSVLKTGGTLFIETPNWTRMFAPFAHFYFYNDYTHIRIFSKFGMSRLLLDSGFTIDHLITVSSCTWFQPASSTDEPRTKATSELTHDRQPLGSRILARLLNPLMKDVLIGIATKRSNETS